MDARGRGGGTSMFDSLGMCRYAWYRFLGSSILKKSIQFRYLASLTVACENSRFLLAPHRLGRFAT